MPITFFFIIALVISTKGLSATPMKREVHMDIFTTASQRTNSRMNPTALSIFAWLENISNFLSIFDSLAEKITDRFEENSTEEGDTERSFTEITDDLKTTMAQAKLEGVKSRYSEDERVIRSSERSLSAYLEVGDSELLIEEFLSEAEQLRRSLNHLMSGLLGELIFGGDILFNIRDAVQCDETKFQEQAITYLDLLNVGIEVHAIYISFKKISPQHNGPFQRNMERKVGSIKQRVKSVGEGYRKQMSETTDEEMQRILRKWTSQDQPTKRNDDCNWMDPLHNRLENNFGGDVKMIIANVKGEGVMNRYSYDEKVIRSCVQSLDAFLEVEDSEFLKEEFFSDAKQLKASIGHLMSGLMGELAGGDILLTIKDVVECDGTKFQETVKAILDLLASGIKVHANYINLKKISPKYNDPFQRDMESNTEKIILRVKSIGESCRNEGVVYEELRRILRGWTPQDKIENFNNIAPSNS